MPPKKSSAKTTKSTKSAAKKTTKKPAGKSTKNYNLLDKGPRFSFPHLKQEFQQYFAEFTGTALLTFAITLNLGYNEFILPTAILAALVVGTLVYTIGGISGAHLNPAVTIGLFLAGKTHYKTAIMYILAQITGAMAAFTIYISSELALPSLQPINAHPYSMFEALGAAILVFGVMAVATKKVHEAASGLVVGGSLLLGITLAANHSLALLNPAIAISYTLVDTTFVLSPIIGGAFGALLFKLLTAR